MPGGRPVGPEAVLPRPQGPAQVAFSEPHAARPVPVNIQLYAGFWVRFVAFVIDAIAVGIVTVPVSAIIAVAIGLAGGAVSMPEMGVHLVRFLASFAFSALANWIYEAALESSARQATLGKMALGLKVTDLQGRRISFARATGRHFAKILSGLILLIGYILAGFHARKQALHDMIAGTLVVRTM